MNEKFNKNAKVEQLTKMFLSREEEKGLIVKDPLDSLRQEAKLGLYSRKQKHSVCFSYRCLYLASCHKIVNNPAFIAIHLLNDSTMLHHLLDQTSSVQLHIRMYVLSHMAEILSTVS